MGCIVCATSRPRLVAVRAAWPTTDIEGHEVHTSCSYDLQLALGHIREGGIAVDCDGIITWTTNGRPLFADMAALFVALGVVGINEVATEEARNESSARGIAAYTAYRKEHGYSAEELAEMRAAFGPGETVVDVLTGRRTEL